MYLSIHDVTSIRAEAVERGEKSMRRKIIIEATTLNGSPVYLEITLFAKDSKALMVNSDAS